MPPKHETDKPSQAVEMVKSIHKFADDIREANRAADDPLDPIMQAAERVALLEGILEGYEQWEANLVLNANWEATCEGLPALTYPLYDELMALQDRRNKALGHGPYRKR